MTDEKRKRKNEINRAYYQRNKIRLAAQKREQHKDPVVRERRRILCAKRYAKAGHIDNAKRKADTYREKRRVIDRKRYSEIPEVRMAKIAAARKSYLKRKEAIKARYALAVVKEKINARKRDKYKTDINYRIKCLLRSRFIDALKSQYVVKRSSVIGLIGCSIEYLRSYLEAKFVIGMSWNNHGEWEIDHIIPCARFDLTDPTEQRRCFHYTNLQPLWAHENSAKRCRIL